MCKHIFERGRKLKNAHIFIRGGHQMLMDAHIEEGGVKLAKIMLM